MNTFRAFIPGRPVPTARPRVSKFRTYYPKRTVEAQKKVSEAVREALEKAGSTKLPAFPSEALYVQVDFVFPYPKGTAKKRIKPGWTPRNSQPDLDNLSKTVLDACNKILYGDDRQIVELNVSKHNTDATNLAGYYLKVEVLE